MVWLVIWLGLSILAGVVAGQKGRSAWGFFFLALILSPLIGLIAALVVSPSVTGQEAQALATGQMRKCPYCAELIKPDAVVCRYCGRDLAPASLMAAPVAVKSGMTIQPLHDDKVCTSCGKTIPGDAVRCYYCGEVQPTQ